MAHVEVERGKEGQGLGLQVQRVDKFKSGARKRNLREMLLVVAGVSKFPAAQGAPALSSTGRPVLRWSKPRKAGPAAGAPMDSGVKAAFIPLHGPSHPPIEMNVYFQIRLSHLCSSCMGPTARQPDLVLCQLQLTTAVDPPDQKHPIPRHHLQLIQQHLSPLATPWPCLSLLHLQTQIPPFLFVFIYPILYL